MIQGVNYHPRLHISDNLLAVAREQGGIWEVRDFYLPDILYVSYRFEETVDFIDNVSVELFGMGIYC